MTWSLIARDHATGAFGIAVATKNFAVGARVTVPLHEHAATEALAVIDSERLRVSEITTRVPTLDDVYLELTGARIDAAA